MTVTRKHAGQPHKAGDRVRIGGRGPVYTIASVEYVEAGSSRFDFYRLAEREGRFVRADLRSQP